MGMAWRICYEEKVGSRSFVLHPYSGSVRCRGHLESGSKAYSEGADNLGAESLFVLRVLQRDLTNDLTGADKKTYWPFEWRQI